MKERTQQLAVLLNVMGEENANNAIDNFDTEVADELKQVLKEFESDPPTAAEIELVLDDFERYFNFAFQHIEAEEAENQKVDTTETTDAVEPEDESKAIITFPKLTLTGDTKHDLNRIHPYQLAYAIRNDNPNSIVVVIKSLNDTHAAQTMENLPAEVRTEVFLRIADSLDINPEVEKQILEAALHSAMKVESRVPEVDRTGQLVALSRSLPKEIRVPLLEKLIEVNDELAQSVKEEMYRFEDLLKLESQDIQKVLGQCDTDSLVLALVKSDDEIKEKLLGCMSKRARQTIEDELEFKTNAKDDEIEVGVKDVIGVMMRMDEEGEISLG